MDCGFGDFLAGACCLMVERMIFIEVSRVRSCGQGPGQRLVAVWRVLFAAAPLPPIAFGAGYRFMTAHMSPAASNEEESNCTLRFANSVKQLKTSAVVNMDDKTKLLKPE